jgi:hypothetical protein
MVVKELVRFIIGLPKNALSFGETEEQFLFIYNETKVISCVLKGIQGCDYVWNQLRPAKMVS